MLSGTRPIGCISTALAIRCGTSSASLRQKLAPMQAPMWFGADAGDAYAFVLGLLGWMLEGLDDNQRGKALGALRATVAAHATADGVVYDSGAWLVQARRA